MGLLLRCLLLPGVGRLADPPAGLVKPYRWAALRDRRGHRRARRVSGGVAGRRSCAAEAPAD